jgi:bifunctional UDP-N-acetylglucosamine pyrophosphorylase/glucosamine-1-phosphate N-acetyltransferase
MNPTTIPTTAIVLAAGQGTRMKSALPKVMHAVSGLPIVHFGIQAALDAGCEHVVVVVGYGRQAVEEYVARAFPGGRVRTAVQEQQRGTGDAARAGLSIVGKEAERVLVMNGDVPLVRGDDLRAVLAPLDQTKEPMLAFATCVVDDATGYGRILRKAGKVLLVREHRDLRDDEERAVREINAGIYAASIALFREGLATLAPNNAQGELYLTDVVAFASNAGEAITTVQLGADVLAGINDREQLAEVDRLMQARIVRDWRLAGITVREGARIEAGVHLEPDAVVEGGAVLRGRTRLARGATVDVGCVLTDVDVGEGAVIKPYSVGTDARVGPRAQIGPFAHLRPASDIGEEAHVGNFVETKKTTMGRGAKANHLAYLGDAAVGERVNYGAGSITANYDGANKHKTVIGADVHVGSNCVLIAPVQIGEGATIGGGSTINRDAPAGQLTVARARQMSYANWTRPKKGAK